LHHARRRLDLDVEPEHGPVLRHRGDRHGDLDDPVGRQAHRAGLGPSRLRDHHRERPIGPARKRDPHQRAGELGGERRLGRIEADVEVPPVSPEA